MWKKTRLRGVKVITAGILLKMKKESLYVSRAGERVVKVMRDVDVYMQPKRNEPTMVIYHIQGQ